MSDQYIHQIYIHMKNQTQLDEEFNVDPGFYKGEKGDKGDKGDRGPQGIPGPRGLKGEKGDKGDTGAQGVQGPKGDKGDTGAQGVQGPKGDKGDTGAQGVQGPKGDKGDKGDTGDPGDLSDYVTKEELEDVYARTKNLLQPDLIATTMSNGVTCTPNGDGTFTLNGAATDTAVFRLKSNILFENDGSLKHVGCPAGGSLSKYKLDLTNSLGVPIAIDTSDGAIYDFGSDVYNWRIVVYSGVVCDNLVFKPMVTTDLNATYDDYVPYGSFNDNIGRLTKDVGELRLELEQLKTLLTNLTS